MTTTITVYPCGCRRGAETHLCPAAEQLRDAANRAYRRRGPDSAEYLEAKTHWRSHTEAPFATLHDIYSEAVPA